MATATDAELLLAACRAEPEEDAVRLALADAIQSDGFEGGACYIRESIEHHNATKPKAGRTPRRRKAIAQDYARWMMGALGVVEPTADPDTDMFIGGESWDVFHWRVGDRWSGRECRFDIQRGLPYRISITCPMLMERAKDAFIFPLTSVFVTGRRPERDHQFTEWQWNRALWPSPHGTWIEEKEMIPEPLYRLIRNDDGTIPHGVSRHRGVGTAVKALSTAALAFGRAAVAAH